MLDPDLVFTDEYYLELADTVIENGRQLEVFLSRYISILEGIRDIAIIGGETSDELIRFINGLINLEGNLECYSELLSKQCRNLVHAVDSADSFLF